MPAQHVVRRRELWELGRGFGESRGLMSICRIHLRILKVNPVQSMDEVLQLDEVPHARTRRSYHRQPVARVTSVGGGHEVLMWRVCVNVACVCECELIANEGEHGPSPTCENASACTCVSLSGTCKRLCVRVLSCISACVQARAHVRCVHVRKRRRTSHSTRLRAICRVTCLLRYSAALRQLSNVMTTRVCFFYSQH